MNTKLVEFVPNISEGRNLATVAAVVEGVKGAGGAILDTFIGSSTNRTVLTIVAPLSLIEEVAFTLFRIATSKIDMRFHKGTHPRMGAVDVAPFVPLGLTTVEECKIVAKRVAERVWAELKVPSYLYAHSAQSDSRRLLSSVRKGEYEGLSARVDDPKWTPDVGALTAQSSCGVTAIGCRDFLIAYNVNLNTSHVDVAKEIAYHIRESGAPGSKSPGLFKEVSAIGWLLSEKGIAQISTNIRDFRISPVHEVFDACRNYARDLGAEVVGSELVGLMPKEVLLLAGRPVVGSDVDEDKIIRAGIEYLNLSQFAEFNPDLRILEKRIQHAFNG